MKIGEAFPSMYLKVEDLKGRRVPVTIDRVVVEIIGQGKDQDEKPVLYFVGAKKGLALNRTNANLIVDILGTDETDNWSGQRIVLYPDRTTFQGKVVPCIRVAQFQRAQQPAQAVSKPARAPQPQPLPEEDTLAEAEAAETFQASDDDVSFLNT